MSLELVRSLNCLRVLLIMGLKRYLDEEEFQGFSSKHPKQLDCGNNLTFLAENKHSFEVCQKNDLSGKPQSIFCKFQIAKELESDSVDIGSDFTGKELETSAPLSGLTSSASEEDARSRAVLFSSFYPEYLEFNFPRRTFVPCEDTYSSLLDSSPRREVPLGPNHQADVPVWHPDVIKRHSLSSNCIVDNDNDMTLMGSCVIPMPDSKLSAHFDKLENDIIDCNCMDNGSIRCIRQHVKEAQEKLRETLGNEKFMQLGFCDMGEEVVHKWTEGEERAFHEVVYSNPVSSGKKYWELLRTMFPSRTKMELVSYYFNVFMLRRRAIQNRSNLLEIDSDDDEWQENDRTLFCAGGENESLTNQDIRVDRENDFSNEYDNENDGDDDDDDDEDDDYDNNDEDGHLQVDGEDDVTHKDGGRAHIFKPKTENAIREDFYAYDDSCTSFESHPYTNDSYGQVCETVAIQGIRVKRENGKCGRVNRDMSIDGLAPEYLMEGGDAKVWDATYSMGIIKGLDLLPTCNMIEEIFGPCSWNSKSSNDKSIS